MAGKGHTLHTTNSIWLRIKCQNQKSIEAQEFVVLDTEASGLEPTQSQLLSIGAIKISNRSFCVDDALVIHLPVGSNPSEAEVAIHGIIKRKIQP